MPSFKTLLLPATLALAATATAATCPSDWLPNTVKGQTKCCYGNMMITGEGAFCCVYDLTPPIETSSTSTATSSSDDYAGWSTAGECFTTIPMSASDYTDLVSSASSKIAATRATVATNEATSTSTSSSSTSYGVGSATESASPTGSSASAAPASSTSNAAMPIATAQEIVLGGAAVVVGLFVL